MPSTPSGDLLVQDEQPEEAVRVYERIERLHARRCAGQATPGPDLPRHGRPGRPSPSSRNSPEGAAGPGTVHFALAELHLQAGDAPTPPPTSGPPPKPPRRSRSPWLKLAALFKPTRMPTPPWPRCKAPSHHARQSQAAGSLGPDPDEPEPICPGRTAAAAGLETRPAEDPDAIPSNLFFYNYATVCTHLRRTADAAGWLRRAIEQTPPCWNSMCSAP
jgi:hypothetical protein